MVATGSCRSGLLLPVDDGCIYLYIAIALSGSKQASVDHCLRITLLSSKTAAGKWCDNRHSFVQMVAVEVAVAVGVGVGVITFISYYSFITPLLR
jgi:hypothetical protein